MHKAIFLDKDGTLVTDVPYNVDTEKIILEKGVLEGLIALQNKGYKLVIVSNQSGIALNLFSISDLENLISHMIHLFAAHDIHIAGFYYCPHLPVSGKNEGKNCECQKPQPGMLFKAAEELEIDLSASWMIGDILNDVEAGARAGCKTILIDNGNETEWDLTSYRSPRYKAVNFLDASHHILKQ